MLRYTGHPLVDAGTAAVTAFVDKTSPQELGKQNLEEVAKYISKTYPRKPASKYVQLAFTINAVYTQPSVKDIEKRQANSLAFLLTILSPENSSSEYKRCVYCGRQALLEEVLSMKQVSGPITRQHVPLVLAKGLINFFPSYVDPGLPICGFCLFAIQALPLGAASCEGRLLIVHSDDEKVTRRFAKRFCEQHQRTFLLDLEKYPSERFPKTILVNEIANIERDRRETYDYLDQYGSIRAYHLTNYGSNADIAIYELPSQVVSFLVLANSEMFRETWREIVKRAWQRVDDARSGLAKNFLYEDLFDLPDNAAFFIRTYFLRRALRAGKDDPRRNYELQRESSLISWELTAMFLREVMDMDQERVEAIKVLGDRLSKYTSQVDRNFYTKFFYSKGYGELRGLLIRACHNEIQSNRPPIIGLDEFITIFEDGYELPKADWWLARDLVLIRVIERLHEQGYRELVPDDGSEDESS